MRNLLAPAFRAIPSLLFKLLCVVVAIGAFRYMYQHAGGAPGSFEAKFPSSGWDVPAHFFAAGLALVLVPLQLSAWVRARAPQLHRIGGWLSVAAILIGGLSGLSLAADAQGGALTATSFTILALIWLLTMGNGVRHALAGNFVAHRRWMMRCIAMTSAAITLRLTLGFLLGALHWDFDAAYPVAAWVCWPFNLLVCEMLLRRSQGRFAALPVGRRSGSGRSSA